MCEDFGYFGDESFLDEHNFALELNEIRAMEYEQMQDILREQAASEEEREADLQAEWGAEARWEGVYADSGEWDDDPNPYSGTYSEE